MVITRRQNILVEGEITGEFHHSSAARVLETGLLRVSMLITLFYIRDYNFCFCFPLFLEIFSACDWILISRWDRENSTGIIFLNIYVPSHTRGFTAGEVLLLKFSFEDLIRRFPGDKFIFGGDFNLDRGRLDEERYRGQCFKYVFKSEMFGKLTIIINCILFLICLGKLKSSSNLWIHSTSKYCHPLWFRHSSRQLVNHQR